MKKLLAVSICSIGMLCLFAGNARAGLFTSGHGDIGVAYEGGELELHWHVASDAIVDGMAAGGGADGMEFEAPDLRVQVNGITMARPAGAAWDPVGNAAGEAIWFLPQTETVADAQGKPYLGLAAEEGITAGDWTGFTWEITSLSGPGQFSLWQDGVTTPNFFASSVDGLPDAFAGPLGGEDHFNFGFTALGTYDVGFRVSGTHDTDGFKSHSATFRFEAVPEPSSLAVLATLGIAGTFVRRRRS